jgi:hypothetical protein
MRMTLVVMTALLCASTLATAEERGTRSDALFCSERCETTYETCMRWRTGKGTRDCPGDLMRCRNTCEPPAARAAAQRARPPLSCRDACQSEFDACVHRDDGKHGEACAKSVMVCRDGCPPKEPSANDSASRPQPPTVKAADAAPVKPAPKSHVAAPSSAQPAKVAAPARAETHSAASVAATDEHVSSSATASVAAGTTPRERGPGIWSRMWCAITRSCGPRTSTAPVSCEDACRQSYDNCLTHEDPKRGGDCATASVRCRTKCDTHKSTPASER